MTKRDTNDPLTPEQLAELRAGLLARRATVGRHEGLRTGVARGDQPDHMDAATDATDDDERILLSEHDRVVVREIDDAVARLDAGTYGVSERSGEPIGFARLRAVPWARLTILEAEDDERQQRR